MLAAAEFSLRRGLRPHSQCKIAAERSNTRPAILPPRRGRRGRQKAGDALRFADEFPRPL